MDRVDALVLGRGYIGVGRAAELAATITELRTHVLDWLRVARDAQDWRRFERLAAIAVHLHPEGLGPVLSSVVALNPSGASTEDLIDMLGELRAPEAVEPISGLVRERKDSDGPFSRSA